MSLVEKFTSKYIFLGIAVALFGICIMWSAAQKSTDSEVIWECIEWNSGSQYYDNFTVERFRNYEDAADERDDIGVTYRRDYEEVQISVINYNNSNYSAIQNIDVMKTPIHKINFSENHITRLEFNQCVKSRKVRLEGGLK